MMDDLEFVRRCYANPHDQSAEFLARKQDTASSTQLCQELQMLDKKVQSALKVNVPEGLAERIILKQTLNVHNQHYQQRRQFMYAIAASFIGGIVALTLSPWKTSPAEPELPKLVLQHIYREIAHLSTQDDVQMSRINSMIQTIGGVLNGDVGSVHFAAFCPPIRKTISPLHLVIDGRQGSVTLLFMPKEYVDTRLAVSDDRFQGIIIPSAIGSTAIIGEQGEALEDIERRLQHSIVWQT